MEFNIPIFHESSSWGPDEPDIWRPYQLVKSLVEHLDVDDDSKDRADFAADRIKDELETALAHYQAVTDEDFHKLNLSRQRAMYESLYSDLWTLYKDRMQQYLKEIGINAHFIFAKNTKDFHKYAEKFVDENPNNKDFVQFAYTQRNSWQDDLARNRNAHEHSGDLRGNIKEFDNPTDASRLFVQVCWSLETVIANLVSWKLKREWNVIETNPKSTVFDRCERFTIEHAILTNQRNKK